MRRSSKLWLALVTAGLTATGIVVWERIVENQSMDMTLRQGVALGLFSMPAAGLVIAWLRSGNHHRRRNVLWLGLYCLLSIGMIPICGAGTSGRSWADYVIRGFWISGPIAALLMVLFSRPVLPSGSCQTCGYDLRATPDRCPECGTHVSKPGGAAAG